MKLFVKSLLEAIFGKLIFERENWLNHLENSQELQFIYSKAFSVSLPHIARTLYFRQGTEIDPHKHDTDNHGVVTQGQLILIVDNQEKIFDTGDWYHLPPNCVHAARFQQETSIIEFWFKK